MVSDLRDFLNQPAPNCELFGATESRLDSRISDLPGYQYPRQSPDWYCSWYTYTAPLQTHADGHALESDCVECIWLELEPRAHAPLLFECVLFCIGTLQFGTNCFTTCVDDRQSLGCKLSLNASMLLLGFLIAFWVNSSWDSTVTLPGPTQLTESPTRIMQTIKRHSLRSVYLT